MVVTKMSSKHSTVDMLKKLTENLDNHEALFLQKRKITPQQSPKSSPSKIPKKHKIIEKSPIMNAPAQKFETTTVDLLDIQKTEQERKKSILAAKLLLQQVEEEDFEINHPMLHDKYKDLYTLENIEEHMLEWKNRAVKNYQPIVNPKKKNSTIIYITEFIDILQSKKNNTR